MFTLIKSRKSPSDNCVMSTTITRLKQVPSVNNGVLSSSNTFEDYDFVDALKDFVSSDFTIDNLIQIGSYDMLKPSYVSTMSDMSFADKFQNINLESK